jgi:hypothetical protein
MFGSFTSKLWLPAVSLIIPRTSGFAMIGLVPPKGWFVANQLIVHQYFLPVP